MYTVPILNFYLVFWKTKNNQITYTHFESYESLLHYISYNHRLYPKIRFDEIGNHWNDSYSYFDEDALERRGPFYCQYIVKNAYGATIPAHQIREDIFNLKYNPRKFVYTAKQKKQLKKHSYDQKSFRSWEFRKDPVPFTHKHKRYGRYFRHPKTLNEMKLNNDIEYSSFVRPKRRKLPTLWDDYYCSNLYDRSWKRTKKKKQWM